MSLEHLASWLRCPNCHLPLEPTAVLTLGCASGHRFDVNKRGYVTLLDGQSNTVGDTSEMINDRGAFLDSGAYSPIAAALVRLLSGRRTQRVLDAGCGTGYYLRQVFAQLPDARGLALDRASAAVRIATRSSERISGLVADTWRALPVRDSACDVVLDIFSPRNSPEFHRVLSANGTLIVVVPREDHLHELREAAPMLSVPHGKADLLREQLAAEFSADAQSEVRFTVPLTSAQAHLLRTMGPTGHHSSRTAVFHAPPKVTVAVEALRFTRR